MTTDKTIKRWVEFYILDCHLCKYPDGKSFNQVLNLILKEDSDVVIFDDMEYYKHEELVADIRAEVKHLQKFIAKILKLKGLK